MIQPEIWGQLPWERNTPGCGQCFFRPKTHPDCSQLGPLAILSLQQGSSVSQALLLWPVLQLFFPHQTLSSQCTSSISSTQISSAVGYWPMSYLFNWVVSSSSQGLLFHISVLSFGAWCGPHIRCSTKTTGWLTRCNVYWILLNVKF